MSSCSLFRGALSQPPTIVPRTWQVETVLVEPANAELGTPSVFLDGKGQAAVAVPDRSFYMGTQAIALGRRMPEGWRVEFPIVPTVPRVCGGAGEGDAVVLTYGELDGPLTALSWDGVVDAPAPAGPCPKRELVRQIGATEGEQRIERSQDGRTLWHRVAKGEPCGPHDAQVNHKFAAFAARLDGEGLPQLAVFESKEPGGPGRLRHVLCRNKEWTSSVVADGVVVTDVDLAIDQAGHPHLGYVVDGDEGRVLTYAVPVEAGLSPMPQDGRDARVEAAVEACMRVHALPPSGVGVDRFQSGDGFRCAVLERDPEPPKQALALLTERCEAGQADSCAVAASLHHWLMGAVTIVLQLPSGGSAPFLVEWRGLRPSGVTEDEARAAELYGKACEGGDVSGCLNGAVLLPAEDPRRLVWARQACFGELAHGCALAVAQTGMKPKKALSKPAIKTMRKACEADDLLACASLGVLLVTLGQKDQAAVPLDRACEGGVVAACAGKQALSR